MKLYLQSSLAILLLTVPYRVIDRMVQHQGSINSTVEEDLPDHQTRSQTFYVDKNHPQASDSNPGTSDLPWLTIQHAANMLQPGDTVWIKAGVYYEQMFTTRSGNVSEGWIVFSAYPGDTVTIDGTGVITGSTGMIIGHSYLKITGLKIANWPNTGMWITGADHIELQNLEVFEVPFGIGAANGTHDFLLDQVNIHDFDFYGFDASPSGGDPCYNGTFTNCVAHTGRDDEQNVDGFALGHGSQHDFIFSHCTTYEVYDGFDISSRNTHLDKCLSHDCWNTCFKLWQDSVLLTNCIGYNGYMKNLEVDWIGEPTTTTLINCSFFDNQVYTIWISNSADTLKMYNCIVSGGENIGLSFEEHNASCYIGDYNIFHNFYHPRAISVGYTDEFSLVDIATGAWTSYSGQDAHSLVVYDDTTLFACPASYDLHLLQNSLAVNTALSILAPPSDFEGNPRPVGSGYDIGAYEYPCAPLQILEIPAGWSGISLFTQPCDPMVEHIFQEVVDHLVIQQDMIHVYWPTQSINTIVNWDMSTGYKVKVNSSLELTLWGNNLIERSVSLLAGWNILPVLDTVNVQVTSIGNQLGDKLTIIKEIAGTGVYWPDENISTLNLLNPGKAYMIHVKESCLVNY